MWQTQKRTSADPTGEALHRRLTSTQLLPIYRHVYCGLQRAKWNCMISFTEHFNARALPPGTLQSPSEIRILRGLEEPLTMAEFILWPPYQRACLHGEVVTVHGCYPRDPRSRLNGGTGLSRDPRSRLPSPLHHILCHGKVGWGLLQECVCNSRSSE